MFVGRVGGVRGKGRLTGIRSEDFFVRHVIQLFCVKIRIYRLELQTNRPSAFHIPSRTPSPNPLAQLFRTNETHVMKIEDDTNTHLRQRDLRILTQLPHRPYGARLRIPQLPLQLTELALPFVLRDDAHVGFERVLVVVRDLGGRRGAGWSSEHIDTW